MDTEAVIRGLFAGVTSNYDTHRPALCEAIVRTTGPIIELGMGEGSTRALHGVAETCSRIVHSYDHVAAWVARYSALETRRHLIRHVASWDDCPVELVEQWGTPRESSRWGVAFVDHAPAERRVVDIQRLAQHSQVVVVHDTEDPTYGYERVFATFAHRLDYRSQASWTTILSNFTDVSSWVIAG